MAFISKLAHCFNCSFSLSLLLGKISSCLGWGGGLGTWLGFKYNPFYQRKREGADSLRKTCYLLLLFCGCNGCETPNLERSVRG